MDLSELAAILTLFTVPQRQLLMTLDDLLNDHKRLTQILCDTRNRIKHLEYFRMIHESDPVCRQSTRMDIRCFAILRHLLRTTVGLALMKIDNIEEMVAMFLHLLVHDMKNHEIQWEFIRFRETVSQHFNIALLVMLRLLMSCW